MSPCLELAAESLGIEMLYDRPVPAIEEDYEKDENKEAAELERNCNIGEIPNRNNNDEREGDH